MSDESWRTDMALDFYDRLPESQKAAFKDAYLAGVREHIKAGDCPACVGVRHLLPEDAEGWRECPTTHRKFKCS